MVFVRSVYQQRASLSRLWITDKDNSDISHFRTQRWYQQFDVACMLPTVSYHLRGTWTSGITQWECNSRAVRSASYVHGDRV